MVSTIQNGDDRLEVAAGQTLGGGDLVIVPTQTGLYRIEHRGSGASPAFTDQTFTSLLLARRAVENYRREIAGELAKKALIEKIATSPSLKEQRKAKALAEKNGELQEPDTDEE